MLIPESIKKLTRKFSEFPGIGPRQASRFVFYLLNLPSKNKGEIAQAINDLNSVKICINCKFPTTDSICSICSDENRFKNLICIVERTTDLLNIEKTRHYKGTYYILNNNLFNNDKRINLNDLKKRIEDLSKNYKPQEIELILATNSTTEGEATALYIESEIKPMNIKISRLGRGLPSGAELEYTDPVTLQNAFENRKNN